MKAFFCFTISIFSLFIYSQVKSTYVYSIKGEDTLKLDVYSPDIVDSNKKYPTMLWIHGGGFAGGSRDYKDDVALCETLARKGYIAISISYRLLRKGTKTQFGCDCPKEDKLETFKQAIIDYYDAAKYIWKHSEELSIDTDYVLSGGSSAGAETVLNAVYLKEYFLDHLENYSDIHFAGVWSLAGAVVNDNYITQDNTIPTVLFHGTDDNLVPFGSAPHHYCAPTAPGYLMLDGSDSIAKKLQSLTAPYYFYEVQKGKHEIASIPIDQRLDEVLDFFDRCIENKETLQIHKIIMK